MSSCNGVETRIAIEILKMHLNWQEGRSTSPDSRDYVLVADLLLSERVPGYVRAHEDGINVVADAIFEKQSAGSLGSAEDIAAYVVSELMVEELSNA